jgi:hypothetical protein
MRYTGEPNVPTDRYTVWQLILKDKYAPDSTRACKPSTVIQIAVAHATPANLVLGQLVGKASKASGNVLEGDVGTQRDRSVVALPEGKLVTILRSSMSLCPANTTRSPVEYGYRAYYLQIRGSTFIIEKKRKESVSSSGPLSVST